MLRDAPMTRGRLTWLWGADGNLVVDEAATYPVLMAIVAHKGAYRWIASTDAATRRRASAAPPGRSSRPTPGTAARGLRPRASRPE